MRIGLKNHFLREESLFLFICFISFVLLADQTEIVMQPNLPVLKHFEVETNKFILVTSLYNETQSQRVQEYLTCMEKNLSNQHIAHIHVIYQNVPGEKSEILDYLVSKNISVDFVSVRPTYGSMFDLINKLYAGKKVIVSNADIYFNETLALLDNYDLTNTFLALSRWQVNADGSLTPYFTTPIMYSQDTWIFKAPIQKFANDAIELGTCGCDSRIAYQAFLSGMKVLNPCGSIQCCHVHSSGIRNRKPCKPMDPNKDAFMGLKWGYLGD